MVRVIDELGAVTHLAGSERTGVKSDEGEKLFWRNPTVLDSLDGRGKNSFFGHLHQIAVGAEGMIYVADAGYHAVRTLTPEGLVRTVAGSLREAGFMDGMGATAMFRGPEGLALGDNGEVFIADTGNHVIRRMTADGNVTTIGGKPGYAGIGEGIGGAGFFSSPARILVDGEGVLWVSDRDNHRIVRGVPTGSDNQLPRFTGYELVVPADEVAELSVAKIMARVSDPDGDELSLRVSRPTTSGGGGLRREGARLIYEPAEGFVGVDWLTLEVSDDRGGKIEIQLRMEVGSAEGGGGGDGNVAILRQEVGGIGVRFFGIPGVVYQIERSFEMETWELVTSMQAGPDGKIEFFDAGVIAPRAYYRLKQ